MTSPIIAIVTGANRGIGHAICESLASSFQKPLFLYATSRKRGDLGFKPSSSSISISYPQLDIANHNSVQSLAQTIKEDHDGLDVLINNAGANLDDKYSPENVQKTLDINYRGTLDMCQTFQHLLRPNSRIVNVSSTASSLRNYGSNLQARFRNPKMSLQDLEAMMQEYQDAANSGTEQQNGWPKQAYAVSKAAMNAMTATLARENEGLVINSCCPGWVATDMGKMVAPMPPKAPADGAKIPMRLGFGDIGGVTGRYWGNNSIAGKGDGQVQEW